MLLQSPHSQTRPPSPKGTLSMTQDLEPTVDQEELGPHDLQLTPWMSHKDIMNGLTNSNPQPKGVSVAEGKL